MRGVLPLRNWELSRHAQNRPAGLDLSHGPCESPAVMSTSAPDLAPRIEGALLGLAVGDALAAPVAGLKSGRVVQLFGEITDYVDAREAWEDRPWRWVMPGLHTSPTQQALSVLAVQAERGEVPPESLARLWLRMRHAGAESRSRDGCHRAAGPTLRRSLDAMEAKISPPGQPSAGSGAAVRAIAIGLLRRGDPGAITRSVIDLALLTHTDARAIGAALAVAHLAGMLACGPEAPVRVLGELIGRVRDAEERLLIDHLGVIHLPADTDVHGMSRALGALPGLLAEGDDTLAEQTLLRQAQHHAPAQPVTSITGGFAPATVPAALYHALVRDRFAAPVSHLASQGRESSTAGAIAGAILGLRLGVEAIPAEWRERLAASEAISLFAGHLAGDAVELPGLLELEASLTRQEHAARAPLVTARAKRLAVSTRREAAHPRPPRQGAVAPPPLPFAPPPHTYLRAENDPAAKRREKAARGRKRIGWKDDRRRHQREP